jgi:hypothetical protein
MPSAVPPEVLAAMAPIASAPARPSLSDVFTGAFQNVGDQLRYALPYAIGKAADGLTADQSKAYQDQIKRYSDANAKYNPAGIGDVTSGKVGLGRALLENAAALPGQASGMIAGGAIGTALGGPVGGIAGAVLAGTPQFAGSNAEAVVAGGKDLTHEAAIRSLLISPFQAGMAEAAGYVTPGLGRLLGASGEAFTGNIGMRIGKSMLATGAAQAAAGVSMEAGTQFASGDLGTNPDSAGRLVDAAATGLAMGGAMGAFGGFKKAPIDTAPAPQLTGADLATRADVIINGRSQQLALPSPQMVVDSHGNIAPSSMTADQDLLAARNAPVPGAEPAPPAPPAQLLLPPPDQSGPRRVEINPDTIATDPSGVSATGPNALSDLIEHNNQPQPEAGPAAPVLPGLPGSPAPPSLIDQLLGRTDQAPDGQTSPSGLAGFTLPGGIDLPPAPEPVAAPEPVPVAAPEPVPTTEPIARAAPILADADKPLYPPMDVSEHQPDAERPLTNLKSNDLTKVYGSKDATDVWRAAIDRERGLRQGELTGAVPVDASTFQNRLTDLKEGLRGGWVSKLTADNPGELVDKVFHQVFEEQDQASSVNKLAARMGILDPDTLKPTPWAESVLKSKDDAQQLKAANDLAKANADAAAERKPPSSQAAAETEKTTLTSMIDSLRTKADDGTTAITRGEEKELRALVDDKKFDAAHQRMDEILRAKEPVDEPEPVAEKPVDKPIAEEPNVPTDEEAESRPEVEPRTDDQIVEDRNKIESERTTAVADAAEERASEPPNDDITQGPIPDDRTVGVRAQVDRLHQNGAITDAQRQGLHDMIDRGDLDGAHKRALELLMKGDEAPKGTTPDPSKSRAQPITEDRVPPIDAFGNPEHDEALARGIDGKTTGEAAKYLADNAPSRFHRQIMSAVADLAAKLEGPNWKSNVRVIREGDTAIPAFERPGVAGASVKSRTSEGVKSELQLKDGSLNHAVGTSYVIASHELLHSVLSDAIDNALAGRLKTSGSLKQGVKDLQDLLKAVTKHYNGRKAGIADGSIEIHPMESMISRGGNAIKNVHELVSWGLTHPDMQEYLQSIKYPKQQSAYGTFISALRKMLGLKDTRMDTALSELARTSEELLRPGKEDLNAYRGLLRPNETARLSDEGMRTPQEAESKVKQASDLISSAFEKIDGSALKGMTDKVQKGFLYAFSSNHIVRLYGDTVKGVTNWRDAHVERSTVRNFMQRMGAQSFVKFEGLEPEMQKRVNDLMAKSTEFQVDPMKTLDQHTWLTDKALAVTGMTREQAKAMHADVTKTYNDLQRGDGQGNTPGADVYHEFRALGEIQALQSQAELGHMTIQGDEHLKTTAIGQLDSPSARFVREVQSSDLPASLKFWRDTVDQQVAAASKYLEDTRGTVSTLGSKDQAAVRATFIPLDNLLSSAAAAKKSIEEAPYFHLGRSGNLFGTGLISKGEDGYANPASQKAVTDALEKNNFGFAQMSTDNRQPRFMIRFDNQSQQAAFDRMAAQLHAQGHLEEGGTKSGPRDVVGNFGLNVGAASLVAKIRKGISESPLYAEKPGMSKEDISALASARQNHLNMVDDIWLNQQPDSSLARTMARRSTRPGYDSDMARNWMSRWQVGASGTANLSTMSKFETAMSMMGDHYKNALTVNADGTHPADPHTALNVMREIQMRDAKDPINPLASTFGQLRGYAHSYFLGANPAYMLTQMAQIGTNALPELAKTHGFVKSFSAMRGATADATAIMRAVMQEMGPLPLSKKMDGLTISDAVLNRANVTPQMREFLTHLMATGTIDIGSMARAAQQAKIKNDPTALGKAGEHLDMVSHLAAMPAMGMETYSRLIVALAARSLHGDFSPEAMQYASKSVRESMFDYQSWNTGRAFGNKGVLGAATPIVSQFMSYSMQMIEKLHGEMLDSFAGPRAGESAEVAASRKSAARTYLIGHTAAMTTLAGTLGLPFATVGAAVLEKLVRASGVTGQKDWDATAAYRDFLSDALGKNMGEIVARGLPRAIGIDMSGRLGEQNLLPMSGFIANKASWKDAVGDEANSAAGAMPSMFGNFMGGAAKFADGDWSGGMKEILPTALKNPVEVYRMATQGYVDSKGNRLPLNPHASDYLAQLLGYTPADKAEYMEARADQMERSNVLQQRGGAIKTDLLQGMMAHDSGRVQSSLDRARAFDQANPGFMIAPTLGRALQKEIQQRAIAVGTQSPVGTRMRDVAGQQLTRYANDTEQ